MKQCAYDPFVNDGGAVSMMSFDQVISASDVISIHLPATAETTKIINTEVISKMKKNAIVVSVGRGEVIDEVALESALRAGAIAGAALDVREVEPAKDQRFTDLSDVILTPHIAGITVESQAAINKVLVSEVEAALQGLPQKYAVGSVQQSQR